MIPTLETENFTYEHLFDSLENESLIKDFTVKNPAGKNLAVTRSPKTACSTTTAHSGSAALPRRTSSLSTPA